MMCGRDGWRRDVSDKEEAHHASDFSITSSLTKASRHCCKLTLPVRWLGIGSVRYMNVLYVVDV